MIVIAIFAIHRNGHTEEEKHGDQTWTLEKGKENEKELPNEEFSVDEKEYEM